MGVNIDDQYIYFRLSGTDIKNNISIICSTNTQKGTDMTQIDIYTKPWCPYCGRAVNLLERKGVQYNEINVTSDLRLENEMKVRSQRQTVPQIFINDVHIGGSDELMLAEKNGLLDSLLSDEIEAPQQAIS
jgi:glutaredoxin 3